MSCCSSCLFGLFKSIYVVMTMLVLTFHALYIYRYVENLGEPKSFFNHNQLAHLMGMFLGFLFRISGLLSAIKEKIALTCTYSLFLMLVLLLSRQVDAVFVFHAVTAVFALLFVLWLKFRRHKQRRRLLRHQVPPNTTSRSSNNNNNQRHISVDLVRGPGARVSNARPTAPPLEAAPPPVPSTMILNHQANINDNNSCHINPNYDPNYQPPLNYTPPPSYTELFESK